MNDGLRKLWNGEYTGAEEIEIKSNAIRNYTLYFIKFKEFFE